MIDFPLFHDLAALLSALAAWLGLDAFTAVLGLAVLLMAAAVLVSVWPRRKG